GQPLPVDGDLAVGDRLETVQAAAQGGLPGAGGADQRHHLAAVDVQVDVLQRLEVAEELVDAARGDERVTDAAALVHAPRMLCSATSVHIMTRLAACRNGFVTAAGTALTPCAAPGAPRAAAAAAPPRRPPRPLARPAPTGRGRRGGAGGSGLVGALVDRVEGGRAGLAVFDRAGDDGLRGACRLERARALGELGGDRGREGAACAGDAVLADLGAAQLDGLLAVVEHVHRVRPVEHDPALGQHDHVVGVVDAAGRLGEVLDALD